MASGSSVVKFDQVQGSYFFLCSKCRTHIAFYGDETISAHLPTRSINVETAVNLVKSTPPHTIHGPGATMEYMVCVGCNSALGWKYVEVTFPTNLIREGRYILFLDRLLYWTGVRIKKAINALARTE